MARPRKPQSDSRSERLNLRLLPDERAAIEARAAALGLPPSVYARNRALGGKRVTAARRVADPSMVMAINRVGVNLNQMVRAINSGAGYAPAVLTETLERINSLLDRLQE